MKRRNTEKSQHQDKFQDPEMGIEMMRSYESILFLGTSAFNDLEKFKSELLAPYHLCMEYFMEKGDYSKVHEIIKLLSMMDGYKKRIVDEDVIDSININLN